MEPADPLVSVVMPVFDAERYLAEAIESVLAQTHRNLELVIVDDGSTDRSLEIAKHYASRDPRVAVFENARNMGIPHTLNRLLSERRPESPYIARMDGDDVCMPDRLALQVAFLQAHPDHAAVGGQTLIIDERSMQIGVRRYPCAHDDIRKVITRYNPIAHATAMIRSATLEIAGHYDARYPNCQDYDLWLRMAARFKLANVDAFTLKYRLSATQLKTTRLRPSLRETIDIQRGWLFHRPFFRPFNVLSWGLEHGILLLPDAALLRLFKWLTYREGRGLGPGRTRPDDSGT